MLRLLGFIIGFHVTYPGCQRAFLFCFAVTVSGEAAIVNERKKGNGVRTGRDQRVFFSLVCSRSRLRRCRHETKQKQKSLWHLGYT